MVNNSTASNDPIIGTYWAFGDNNTSNQWSPNHTYITDGTYNVTLKLETHNGCQDSLTKSVVIYPVPRSQFTTAYLNNDSCGGKADVFFQNISTGANGYTWYFNWNFDRTDTSSLVSPTKSYTSPELYRILLVAKNAFG